MNNIKNNLLSVVKTFAVVDTDMRQNEEWSQDLLPSWSNATLITRVESSNKTTPNTCEDLVMLGLSKWLRHDLFAVWIIVHLAFNAKFETARTKAVLHAAPTSTGMYDQFDMNHYFLRTTLPNTSLCCACAKLTPVVGRSGAMYVRRAPCGGW